MKTRVFLSAFGLATFLAGAAHARNVELMLPITPALAATDIPEE